jgi:hypothetical protein
MFHKIAMSSCTGANSYHNQGNGVVSAKYNQKTNTGLVQGTR